MKLVQGSGFTCVFHSVHRGGGVYPSMHLGTGCIFQHTCGQGSVKLSGQNKY